MEMVKTKKVRIGGSLRVFNRRALMGDTFPYLVLPGA